MKIEFFREFSLGLPMTYEMPEATEEGSHGVLCGAENLPNREYDLIELVSLHQELLATGRCQRVEPRTAVVV
jgi:hypothetical protein